jgi:hypothetical protein
VGILSQVAKRIKAYHGSPHDFDKFSTENIGTGEGAQAYGHGLYFAEREGTAASYRDALSGKNASFDDGSYVPEWVLQAQKDGKLDTAKKDFQDRIVQIKDAMDSSPQPHLLQDQLDSNAKILQGIDRLNSGDVPKVGRMYEVDIDASPDELLDFDAPISEQSDYIKNALENLNMKTFSGDKRGIDFMSKNNWRGQTLYETLVGANVRGQPQATATLQEVGIKGIKYADAQTRFSPKGRTNNYVIFDDKTVEIARKYGVSMPVAGAILAGTMTAEDAQASVPQVKDGLLKDTGDVLLETMAGVNRGVMDALNFVTTDQVNAVSQLMGSDKRVPTLYDMPLIEEGTSGNFMDKGALRQAVRQGSEFLSPI